MCYNMIEEESQEEDFDDKIKLNKTNKNKYYKEDDISEKQYTPNRSFLFEKCLTSFFDKLHVKYDIKNNDLKDKWKKAEDKFKKVWDASYLLHYNNDKKKVVIKEENVKDEENGCKAILKSGSNKGQNCSLRAKNGSIYCGRHTPKVPEDQLTLIFQNQFNNFEHPLTKLVFNNKKIVYGVQLPDGKVRDLDENDLLVCLKYRFKTIKDEDIFSKLQFRKGDHPILTPVSDDEDIYVTFSEDDKEASK